MSNYVLELAHIYMSWHHNMHLNKFAEKFKQLGHGSILEN